MLNYENAEKYINAILKLEYRLGLNANYKIYSPKLDPNLSLNPRTIYENYDKTAKKYMDFIGFHGKPILVYEANQKENIGGNYNKDADIGYIEVGRQYYRVPLMANAVIAHELMHHYLEYYNIKELDADSNELLTDVATVYMGFGKVSISGCVANIVDERVEGEKRITTTTKLEVGYLDKESFCFVYAILCYLRNISNQVMIADLDDDALMHLNSAMSSSYYVDFTKRIDEKELDESFSIHAKKYVKIRELSNQTLKDIMKRIDELKDSEKQTKQIQNYLDANKNTVVDYKFSDDYNPVARKLKQYKNSFLVEKIINESNDKLYSINEKLGNSLDEESEDSKKAKKKKFGFFKK